MDHKNVLITGCSSGFGLDMTHLFLNAGWNVIATMRNASERQEIFSHQSGNPKLDVQSLDVTSTESIAAMKQHVQVRCRGKLDCLINNAGYGLIGPFELQTPDQMRQQFEVNYFGVAFVTQALLEPLRNSKGSIINISSAFGFQGFPFNASYCASKHALEGLSESLKLELKKHGVRVALIEPGAFRTKFGENIQWSFKGETENVYTDDIKAYEAFFQDLKTKPTRPDASIVAKLALKIASGETSAFRLRAGSDSKSLHIMKKLLPSKIFHYIVSKAAKRVQA